MNAAILEPTATRKGRPRDERIDGLITSMALTVLAESGFERFTVEEVAHQAGVAKTTIYRRFPTRDDLILGALERINDDLAVAPRKGPIRGQLIDVLGGIRRGTPDSRKSRILMHAMGDARRDPHLAELVHRLVLAPRHAALRVVIEAGMASGELRADIDLDAVIPVLVGPMLYLGRWSATSAFGGVSVESIVDLLLGGLAVSRPTPATCS